MSDNNGWPGKLGVPMNPEKSGWYWISLLGGKDNEQAIEWLGPEIGWDEPDWSIEDFGLHARYLGPALTPAEVEARVATARKDALEEAARWHDEQASEAQKLSDMKVSALDSKVWGDYAQNHREYAADIGALAEGGRAMSDEICDPLNMAAEAVLSNLKDRKGVGNEIEQCDDDIQSEIGRTVAAKAIHTFLRALRDDAVLMLLTREQDPHHGWRETLADAVLAAAKGEGDE